MSTDDDRIAFLAGEPGHQLSPDDQAELGGLRDLLGDPATWAEPDPALEDRIVAAIAAEARRPGPTHAARRAHPSHRLVYAAVGAAAVVALAVALVITAGSGGSKALTYAASLSPTALAPQASGTVTLTQTRAGWRVELRVSGLARLDNGRYYEAWMANADGQRVAIGTFNQGPEVTLWSGVSPAQFLTLTVTAQDVSSGTTTVGSRVLAGQSTPTP